MINLHDITKLFGLSLFCIPNNVILISNIFLTNYCNDPNGNHLNWFSDLINQILTSPITLEVYGFYGIASNNSYKDKMVQSIKFIGYKSLCNIDMENFLIHNIVDIHELLSHLIDHNNKCFKRFETGFQGEFFITLFEYNNILNKTFYPEFFIITLFRRYIEIIISAYNGEETGINLVKDSSNILLKFLKEDDQINSFTCKEKTLYYIKKLYKIINEEEIFKNLYQKICLLWEEIQQDECFNNLIIPIQK